MATCKHCGRDHDMDKIQAMQGLMAKIANETGLTGDELQAAFRKRLRNRPDDAKVRPEDRQEEWGVYFLDDDMTPCEPVQGFRFIRREDAADTAMRLSALVGMPAWTCRDRALPTALDHAIRLYKGEPAEAMGKADNDDIRGWTPEDLENITPKAEVMPVMTADEILAELRAGAGETSPENRLK